MCNIAGPRVLGVNPDLRQELKIPRLETGGGFLSLKSKCTTKVDRPPHQRRHVPSGRRFAGVVVGSDVIGIWLV